MDTIVTILYKRADYTKQVLDALAAYNQEKYIRVQLTQFYGMEHCNCKLFTSKRDADQAGKAYKTYKMYGYSHQVIEVDPTETNLKFTYKTPANETV